MNTKPQAPILELDNVSKVYRTTTHLLKSQAQEVVALKQISLRIHQGEIFGLVGESGSGKTTIGRLIVKLEDPDAGRILLKGKDILRLKSRSLKQFRSKIQIIFQDPYQSLNPQMSVFYTISEPLIIHRIGNEARRQEMVSAIMEAVGLSPPEAFIHQYPHQLSGGQRQRVAIARAMVLNPELIVADEPTSMLDASISAHVFNILLEMRDKRNITLVFITHNLAAARYLCDRIAVIYRGYLVELGSTEEIILHPIHPYTQALLDAIPTFKSHDSTPQYQSLFETEKDQYDTAGCPFSPRCIKAEEDRCHQGIPRLTEHTPSHWVACYFPES